MPTLPAQGKFGGLQIDFVKHSVLNGICCDRLVSNFVIWDRRLLASLRSVGDLNTVLIDQRSVYFSAFSREMGEIYSSSCRKFILRLGR